MNKKLVRDKLEDSSQLILAALDLKQFQLSTIGPTAFIFRDEEGNKFKVIIGDPISCSCNKNFQAPIKHCVHTLFVLLKIFKLRSTDERLIQTKFNNIHIDQLVIKRYQKDEYLNDYSDNDENNSEDGEDNAQRQPKKRAFLKKKPKAGFMSEKSKPNEKSNRREIQEDDNCPICYDDLKAESECLTFCKTCGHNFHVKCVLMWAEHRCKESPNKPTTCPNCRGKWDGDTRTLINHLQSDLTQFTKREIIHKGTACLGCNKKNITGWIYKCQDCENGNLCEQCFRTFAHSSHKYYLKKYKVTDAWVSGGLRHHNKIVGEGTTLKNYLLNSLPSCLDEDAGNPNLEIVGFEVQSMKCLCCNEVKGDARYMKKMRCGHRICDDCVMNLFNKKIYKCPKDNEKFWTGLPKEFLGNGQKLGGIELPSLKKVDSAANKDNKSFRIKNAETLSIGGSKTQQGKNTQDNRLKRISMKTVGLTNNDLIKDMEINVQKIPKRSNSVSSAGNRGNKQNKRSIIPSKENDYGGGGGLESLITINNSVGGGESNFGMGNRGGLISLERRPVNIGNVSRGQIRNSTISNTGSLPIGGDLFGGELVVTNQHKRPQIPLPKKHSSTINPKKNQKAQNFIGNMQKEVNLCDEMLNNL